MPLGSCCLAIDPSHVTSKPGRATVLVPCLARSACRYEKVEEAKKEMRKKAELEKRFETDGAAAAGSDDSDLEDEDKIAEQEEAGKLRPDVHLPSLKGCLEHVKADTHLRQFWREACELSVPSHPVLLLRRLW